MNCRWCAYWVLVVYVVLSTFWFHPTTVLRGISPPYLLAQKFSNIIIEPMQTGYKLSRDTQPHQIWPKWANIFNAIYINLN